jgi:phosphoribosylformylglycinamidine cyclo-ligase
MVILLSMEILIFQYFYFCFMDYADSGVNIELGDDSSKIFYEAAKLTWENRGNKFGGVITPYDDFSGVRGIDVSNLPNGSIMNIGFDGVGTKIEIAERMGDFSTIAYDLFAMVCEDAVAKGAEPVLVGSILDVNSLDGHIDKIKQLAQGYVNAAKEANVVVINGEVAELGNRVNGYSKFNCNWGAAVVWFAQKERLFSNDKIKEGDSLIGLKENGFRSNGISLVRKIIKEHHGRYWHNKNISGLSYGEHVLTPSKIYTKAVVEMIGGYNGNVKAEVHGVVHVTGGGIPGKLNRSLKNTNLGALIYEPFEPTEIMLHVQEMGQVPDKEAYKTWNMGQGMIIITPDKEKVIEIATKYGIESQKIGEIISENGIKIVSKGTYSYGKELDF